MAALLAGGLAGTAVLALSLGWRLRRQARDAQSILAAMDQRESGDLTAYARVPEGETLGPLAARTNRLAEALAVSEARFRTLLSSVPGVVYRSPLDRALPLHFVGRDMEGLAGLPLDELQRPGGRGLASLCHPDDRVETNAAISRAVAENEPFEVEYRLVQPSGALRWVRERGRPVFDSTTNRRLLEGVLTDVTRQREAEREIRLLAAIARRTTNSVVLTGPEGLIEWVNDSFTRLTEYELAEVVGRKPGSFLQGPGTDRATVRRMREHLDREEGFKVEIQNYSKSGRSYWIEIEVQPLRDPQGRLIHYMAIGSDISQRREREARLAESERRFRDVADSAGEYIWEVGPDGHYTFLSDRVEAVLGWTPAEMLGQTPLEHMSPETAAQLGPIFQDHLRHPKPFRSIVYEARCKDGRCIWIESSGTPRFIEGAFAGYRGAGLDVSESRRVADELVRAKNAAEAANEAKSAFLAMMSHEIRTPMNGILGFTALLQRTRLDEEQREFVDTIHRSGDSLLSLINDILDFSKIEAGKIELEVRPFELVAAVEATMDLIGARARDKRLELAARIDPALPRIVLGDETRLRQVLNNLLSNAIKFTEKGEVVLELRLQSILPGGEMEVAGSVRDTGIGIPSEKVERLFKTFSQADSSTTRRYGGTGLGLAITKRLTELMGGKVWVNSVLGEGSTFHFTLTLLPGSTRTVPAGTPSALSGRTVLLVEDNATSREILTQQLSSWGASVTALSRPGPALDVLSGEARVDAAVLDFFLPDLTGLELARRIRLLPHRAQLPLLLVSSLGESGSPEIGRSFSAMLPKPCKPAALLERLLALLPAPQAAPAPAPAERPVRLGERYPLRILVAEDHPTNQRLTFALLERHGFRAELASHGAEALELLRNQPFDVVLLDIQMPELDGFGVAEALAASRLPWPKPWIIALTANAMAGDREKCLRAGMNDYLPKPVRPNDLAAALSRAARAIRSAAAAEGESSP